MGALCTSFYSAVTGKCAAITAKGEWPGSHLVTTSPWAVFFWTFPFGISKRSPAQCCVAENRHRKVQCHHLQRPPLPPLKSSWIRVYYHGPSKSYKMSSLNDSIGLIMETVSQVLMTPFIHFLIHTFIYPANEILAESLLMVRTWAKCWKTRTGERSAPVLETECRWKLWPENSTSDYKTVHKMEISGTW